jgi:hypothetical protein
MHRDSYPRFLNSQIYKKLISGETRLWARRNTKASSQKILCSSVFFFYLLVLLFFLHTVLRFSELYICYKNSISHHTTHIARTVILLQ